MVGQQCFSALYQSLGLTRVFFEPLLQDIMHQRSAPRVARLGVYRVQYAQPQYPLGIETEWIGFELIKVGDREPYLALRRIWHRLRAIYWLHFPFRQVKLLGIIYCSTLNAELITQKCLDPQHEARRHGRTAAITRGAG